MSRLPKPKFHVTFATDLNELAINRTAIDYWRNSTLIPGKFWTYCFPLYYPMSIWWDFPNETSFSRGLIIAFEAPVVDFVSYVIRFNE